MYTVETLKTNVEVVALGIRALINAKSNLDEAREAAMAIQGLDGVTEHAPNGPSITVNWDLTEVTGWTYEAGTTSAMIMSGEATEFEVKVAV